MFTVIMWSLYILIGFVLSFSWVLFSRLTHEYWDYNSLLNEITCKGNRHAFGIIALGFGWPIGLGFLSLLSLSYIYNYLSESIALKVEDLLKKEKK